MKTITVKLFPNRYIKAENVPEGHELKVVDEGYQIMVKKDIKFKGIRPTYMKGGFTWLFKGYHYEHE